MSSRSLLLMALLPTFVACDPGCGYAPDLTPGAVEGSIGGSDWTPEAATWMLTATGLQVNAPPASGWRMTMVAQVTEQGQSVVDAVDSDAFPFTVELLTGQEGGFATLNPQSGDTYSTGNSKGGWVSFDAREGDALFGCFTFKASDNRDTVRAKGGMHLVGAGLP